MAVMAIYRREGISAELYNMYRAKVPIERVPLGALAHFYGRSGSGYVSIDVWEDADAMWRFIRERVAPASESLGVPFEPPEVISLETIITTPAAPTYEVPFEAFALKPALETAH
jgi:hypothetical protein